MINKIGNATSFIKQTTLKETIPLGNSGDENINFSDRLKSAISDVNLKQNIGDEATEKVITGELGIHEGMLRLQEAEITLKLLMQVRSKVLDAYKEIMHMQV